MSPRVALPWQRDRLAVRDTRPPYPLTPATSSPHRFPGSVPPNCAASTSRSGGTSSDHARADALADAIPNRVWLATAAHGPAEPCSVSCALADRQNPRGAIPSPKSGGHQQPFAFQSLMPVDMELAGEHRSDPTSALLFPHRHLDPGAGGAACAGAAWLPAIHAPHREEVKASLHWAHRFIRKPRPPSPHPYLYGLYDAGFGHFARGRAPASPRLAHVIHAIVSVYPVACLFLP